MNEVIKNQATGDCIEFLQTAKETKGRVSEFILTLAPKSSWAKTPRHRHPFQVETFQVLTGELHLTKGDEYFVLKPGSNKVIVDKLMLHSFWNELDTETSFRAEIFNPRHIEKGLRLTYKLSQEGKISKNNIPYNPFYTFILMDYFDSYFRIVPWRLQRFMFKAGSLLSQLFGYPKA
ncbi:cupin domain-containing protein [uncultured Psychroserpens sp.]|uniref:cupin domain-containing protein n=1 Tax=uncultured Psychroserpens sp. TaxID=255436 RepID=UPI002618C173|nr:cupin domain-containing protein [uncultured Psychroserpens sp.]